METTTCPGDASGGEICHCCSGTYSSNKPWKALKPICSFPTRAPPAAKPGGSLLPRTTAGPVTEDIRSRSRRALSSAPRPATSLSNLGDAEPPPRRHHHHRTVDPVRHILSCQPLFSFSLILQYPSKRKGQLRKETRCPLSLVLCTSWPIPRSIVSSDERLLHKLSFPPVSTRYH